MDSMFFTAAVLLACALAVLPGCAAKDFIVSELPHSTSESNDQEDQQQATTSHCRAKVDKVRDQQFINTLHRMEELEDRMLENQIQQREGSCSRRAVRELVQDKMEKLRREQDSSMEDLTARVEDLEDRAVMEDKEQAEKSSACEDRDSRRKSADKQHQRRRSNAAEARDDKDEDDQLEQVKVTIQKENRRVSSPSKSRRSSSSKDSRSSSKKDADRSKKFSPKKSGKSKKGKSNKGKKH